MLVKQRWTNVKVVTPDAVTARDLLIDGERFGVLVDPSESTGDDRQNFDGRGRYLYPGMIDVLQHGMSTSFYADGEQGSISHASDFLPGHGTTAFLPAFGCKSHEVMLRLLDNLSDQCRTAKGARALGIHSEGPCFSITGAHDVNNLALPSVALAEQMVAAAGGRLKAVTVSAELPGAEGFIRTMKANGVSVHLGHTRADPEDVPKFLEWGLDAVTHMYDVMPTRLPDATGLHTFSLPDALLAERSLPLGLVADGIHTHPKLIALLSQLPRDRVFLETDALKYAGTEGGQEFEVFAGCWARSVPGGAVHDRNGGLCGSSLTPDEAMRNYIRMGGADMVCAAHATSTVPARVIGMEKEMGSIAPGKLADFILLDPETLTVEATYISGIEHYRRAT